MTKVVIADDHAIVRTGLRALLQADAGLELVGEASADLKPWSSLVSTILRFLSWM